MPELSDLRVGQVIELTDGRPARVRFLGNPHFAAGDWVGVELEESTGKNDGAVQGRRYFDCSPGHGMFVKPGAITVIEDEPTPRLAPRMNGKANGATANGRPPSMGAGGIARRQSVVDPTASKRRSVNAGSPTPSARLAGVSRLASPSKSPTKQVGSNIASGNPTRTNTPSGAARKSMLPPSKPSRPSLAPANRSSRPFAAPTINGSARVSANASTGLIGATSKRISMLHRPTEGPDDTVAANRSAAIDRQGNLIERVDSDVRSQSISDTQEDEVDKGRGSPHSRNSALSPVSAPEKPPSSRGRSPSFKNKRLNSVLSIDSKKIEEYEAKIRILERKRMEDRERFKGLEKAQMDRDRFEGIIQKLQAKLQPQQQEIAELRRQIRDGEVRYQALEAQQAENDTINEMATLDREMAEETAESLKGELESLRQMHEELELEVEVLREENQELGKEMSPEEKTSQGWLQMERTNERLREALIRLRDTTQQQEADLKSQVLELEQDLEDMNKLKEDYQQTKEKLSQSDGALEDVRQQLDTALGAEEMIEELTEKNMAIMEKMDELRLTIEDLESLRELNDELEINHIETEKQLQSEVDYNEGLLAEEARKSAIQDRTIHELEYTVDRFRDLAKNMQSDLEEMRASQQISETEAQELSNRSRAMLDLNMRLQVSASKAQVKAIDLELGRLEAQQSSEHLGIVQLFLPETFKSEGDSIQALLRFRRIGFKAKMLHTFIKERMNGGASPGHEDDVFACCDVLDKLTWVIGSCHRFVQSTQTCDLESFRRLGSAAFELEPIERTLNGFTDSLRRDEVKGEQWATELQRSIALMAHLVEVHITENLGHYADDVVMRAHMMQSHLDTSVTALNLVKSMSENKVTASDARDEEESPEYDNLLNKIDNLIAQTRSARMISIKAIRQLEDLKSRSLTLQPSTLNSVELSQQSTEELATAARVAGSSILKILHDEGRSTQSSDQELFGEIINQASFSSLSTKVQSATHQLQTIYNLTSSLPQTVEFPSPHPPPPWQILAQNMKANTADIAARETELLRIKDEMAEKNTKLAIKDRVAQEMSVKLEVLEKRVSESGGRRERVKELEGEVEATKAREKAITDKLSGLETELRNLESERTKWQQSPQPLPPTSQPGQSLSPPSTSASTLRQMSTFKGEIAALQSSIRYLRSASHAHTLSSAYDFLSHPITPSPTPTSTSTTTTILPAPPPLQTEAKDVLKEMLHLISHPENKIVTLQPRDAKDRLKWQPVRETSQWKAQRLREEWEEWREWRDGVARRAVRAGKEEERRREAWRTRRMGKEKGEERPLAEVQIQLPGNMKAVAGGKVKIRKAEEWEELEKTLGVGSTM